MTLIIYFSSTCSMLCAQGSETIKCNLINNESNAAVPFATIKLKNRWRGVISNAVGDFQLPYRYKLLSDTLEISCIGYDNKIVPINQLVDSQINIIKLLPSTTQLSEVVVSAKKLRKPSAYKIVKTAIKKIALNYPRYFFSYGAYYRDYQLKDNEYINLNEAIIEVFDEGFQTNDYLNTKIKLNEYRRNSDFQRESKTEVAYDNVENKFVPNASLYPFGGNELSILLIHDAIRNNEVHTYSFIYKLAKDFTRNHSFKLKGSVLLDKVALYCIAFDSYVYRTGSSHFAKGKIYIEQDNFAIHKIKYSTYEKEVFLEPKLLYDIQLEYSKVDSLMFLNYISVNNFFKMRNPLDFKVVSVVFDRDTYSFEIELSNKPELTSAAVKTNYNIKIGRSKMKITEIIIGGKNEKTIYLLLEENKDVNIRVSSETLMSKIKIDFKNLTDIDGRKLNKVNYISINQFRELFVQKINSQWLNTSDTLYMNKTKPLLENDIVPVKLNSNYWMNTPLKKIQQ